MALVPFVQKSGAVGPTVYQGSRHGTVERIRTMPTNPNTRYQQNVRSVMAAVASEWRGLTDEVRAGWKALASQMPGNLTGFQAYVQINATLVNAGKPKLEEPPEIPAFGITTAPGLAADDAPSIKLNQLACTVAPDSFIIQAAPPLLAGRSSFGAAWRNLQVLPGHAAPAADVDLTAAYTARFGQLKAGQRIGVRVFAMKDGFKGVPLAFETLITAAGA